MPLPPVLCVWAGYSSCATLLDLLVSWTPAAFHAQAHLWQKWIGVQRKSGEVQMKYQECFPPSRALCMAEESCMELWKIMFLISIHGSMMILHNLLLTKSPFCTSLTSLFKNYDWDLRYYAFEQIEYRYTAPMISIRSSGMQCSKTRIAHSWFLHKIIV